jgi:hypothetical protein
VAQLYASDCQKWGRRTANANALGVLRILAGLSAPPPSYEEALADLQTDPPTVLSQLCVA